MVSLPSDVDPSRLFSLHVIPVQQYVPWKRLRTYLPQMYNGELARVVYVSEKTVANYGSVSDDARVLHIAKPPIKPDKR